MTFCIFIILIILVHLVEQGSSTLPLPCLITFDQWRDSLDFSNSNGNSYSCPSSCFTQSYLSNANQYEIYGNETYSGNSLICKCAYHDGRLSSLINGNFSLILRRNSIESRRFVSVFRNGILSSRSSSLFNVEYSFVNDRWNESRLLDIAIEHEGYLYSSGSSSIIRCRSEKDLYPIEPIEIDQRWKIWKEDPLKTFSTPRLMRRNDSLEFCLNNNGTLLYWFNSSEYQSVRNELIRKYFPLYSFQRRSSANETLSFFLGFQRINGIERWQSISTNENFPKNFTEFLSLSSSDGEDFCTMIHLNGSREEWISLSRIRCNDSNTLGYPLCRLNPSKLHEENSFVYRLDKDDFSPGLNGLNDYCQQFGGDPIYADNAYEWQIIQEIMLFDQDFDVNYAYVGLISPSKQLNDAFWIPRNRSYNSSLNYLIFSNRGDENVIGYHLSKSTSESYYYLYDINPSNDLNRLRFCRKKDVRSLIKRSNQCHEKSCQSKCEEIQMNSNENENVNVQFGFYRCRSQDSFNGLVITHSFPFNGDFVRENLPEDNFVSIRKPFTQSMNLTLRQKNLNDLSSCYQSNNFNDQLRSLTCSIDNQRNKTFQGITFDQGFQGLISITLRNRPMSGHHFRYIDANQNDSQCNHHGIVHPIVRQCQCGPGFYGDQCQFSCPTGYYGQRCSFHCSSSIDEYCQGLLICLADPYGCSCYSGWYGTFCNLTCPTGRYGPNCLSHCSCSSCNRFTGVCNCTGTECYQGIYTRSQLERSCSFNSSNSTRNLILIIVLPLVFGFILIGSIAFLLYRKYFHGKFFFDQ